MIIRKSTIAMITFIAFLLMQYNFFYLLPLSKTNALSITYILITLILFWSVGGIEIFYRSPNLFFYKHFIVGLIIVVIISSLFSLYKYPNYYLSIIKQCITWISIFIYFPMSVFLNRNIEQGIKILTIFTLLSSILFIMQSFVYSVSGSLFLQNSYFSDGSENISFAIRMLGTQIKSPSYFICFLSIILSYTVFLRTRDWLHFCNLLFGLVWLFFVQQTRVLILISILLILVGGIMHSTGRLTLKTPLYLIGMIIVICISLFVFGGKNFINQIILSFSDPRMDASTRVRQEGIEYFKRVIQKNPLLGNGLFIGQDYTKPWQDARGPVGLYYYSDLGFIGNVAQFGTIIIVPLVLFFTTAIKKNKRNMFLLLSLALAFTEFTSLSWISPTNILATILFISIPSTFSKK